MHDITSEQLARATGGLAYGETKSPTGERWAAQVDQKAKELNEYIHPFGAVMLPFLGPAEYGARQAGRIVDGLRGNGGGNGNDGGNGNNGGNDHE